MSIFLFIVLFIAIAIILYVKLSKQENGHLKFYVSLVALVFLSMIILIVYAITAPEPKPEYHKPSSYTSFDSSLYDEYAFLQRATSTAEYYKENYPMTWGYINKNADDPYTYVEFYDNVWGDMQKYTGDGINFDTLTRYEQSLVNYPAIGSYVYFSSTKSREYHSTDKCYSLLKSNPISRPASHRRNYDPCSKCVGD